MYPNAGLIYYRTYYKDGRPIKGSPTKNLNALIEERLPVLPTGTPWEAIRKDQSLEPIQLVTTYPGLLIGSGYNHEAEDNEDAYKIGFHFDHTTGLPVVPGSSVKGKLRSFFPNGYKKEKMDNAYRESRHGFINHLLEKEAIFRALHPDELEQLEREIFHGQRRAEKSGKNPDSEWEPISTYMRDQFLDAFPTEILIANLGREKRLFASDYITPHKHKTNPAMDAFTDPTPIKFLKVLPGVVFDFRFNLHDSKAVEGFTKEHKWKLIKALLLWGGVGAKTNVGYGQFAERERFLSTVAASDETDTPLSRNEPVTFNIGDEVRGVITDLDFGSNAVTLSIHGQKGTIRHQVAKLLSRRDLNDGTRITATVKKLNDDGSIKYIDNLKPLK